MFYFVGIMTNLLVSINMLQGAVVVINALTGESLIIPPLCNATNSSPEWISPQ